MGYDSVFNGDPRTPGVIASGNATSGIDVSTGQQYFKDDAVAGWQQTVGPHQIVVTLTSAQLKALHTTPVAILAAPGAGKYIIPMQVAFQFNFIAPDYTETGSDGNIYTGWGSTTNAVTSTTVAQSFSYSGLVSGVAASQFRTNPLDTIGTPLASVVNQPFSVAMLDTLATGNGNLKIGLAFYIAAV